MPRIDALVQCDVRDSFRVSQVAGMFDVPIAKKASSSFSVEVPSLDEDWQIGVIVGPSGSGKSTIARHAFGEKIYSGCDWGDGSLLDAFPADMSSQEITSTLSSVGFSSPPSWVKPFAVLSNGEKFRCDLAMALSLSTDLIVFDEFTSVVDRIVARIGSAAISKTIRRTPSKKFVAVSCHYDIVEWLEPDWVLDMSSGKLTRGRLRRPEIKLEIRRVGHEVWGLFRKHHYLDGKLNTSAVCLCGFVEDQPVAFAAARMVPGRHSHWIGHRTVVIPDFQGIGIGGRMDDFLASVMVATGREYYDRMAHPAAARSKLNSKKWQLKTKTVAGKMKFSSRGKLNERLKSASSLNRITYSFKYCGPANPKSARMFGLKVPGG